MALRKLESYEVKKYDDYNFITDEGKLQVIKGFGILEMASTHGLDVVVVNDRSTPITVKLLDYQKFLYEQKKKEKEQKKKNKANEQKLKEVKFHIGIADNDKSYKIKHIKEFLEDNCRVKVEVFLRGRENDMKDFARKMLEEIIKNFNQEFFNIESIKDLGNSVFTFITSK